VTSTIGKTIKSKRRGIEKMPKSGRGVGREMWVREEYVSITALHISSNS